MTILRYVLSLGFLAMSILSCQNEKSLQKYLVEKQDDDKFMKIDIAASLLQSNTANFTPEEKDIFNTIKKVNVVAYPIKDGDTVEYLAQKQEIKNVLDQPQYKELTRINSNNWSATLKYTGDEDAINEVIIYASDDKRGFAVFRLLGDKMRPDQMIKLMNSLKNGDIDAGKLSGFGPIFKD